MGPLPALPLLLLLLLPPRAAPAPRGRPLPGLLGCLLAEGLCRASETCVNDGVFGRCQKVPAADRPRYEVSPAALQRLTATLQKLSSTGFTWQDDYTQHVLAQELSELPRTYPRLLEASGTARSSEPSVEKERRYSPGDDGALAKAVQRYLPFLEALSQAAAPNTRPGTRQDRPAAQGEDPRADSVLTFMAQTSALTYAPGPRTEHPGGRPWQARGRLQPDELSPKADSGAERQDLVAALGTPVARKSPVPHREGDPGPRNLLRGPWETARVLPAPAALWKWSSPPGHPENAPALGEGALIQSLLKDLGKQRTQVEGLRPLDLDGMAHMVATAMRGAGAEGELQGAEKGAAGKPGAAGVGELAGDGEADGGGLHGGGGVAGEVSLLGLELGDHLQDPGPRLFPASPLLMDPFKMEMKKSETPRMPPAWEEDNAGVEDVRSQTYSKERLDRPPPAEPRVGGSGEFQTRAPGPSQEDAHLGTGVRGHPGAGLQLEVQPSQEDQGYIVTGNEGTRFTHLLAEFTFTSKAVLDHLVTDASVNGIVLWVKQMSGHPLSPEEGKRLMESAARLLEVPMSVFTDIAVLGPAVTFRVSASVQNLTAADVVQATVDNKDELEKASGLKILHAGSGSKSKLKLLPRGAEQEDSTPFIVLTLVSVAAMVGVLLASGVIYCLRHASHSQLQEKLSELGEQHPGPDATTAYQELCRQRMAVRTSERPDAPHTSRINSVSSQLSDGPMPSPSARSSTSSWSEEPVQSNMDISTGHMVLAYMEDHLKNRNRLQKEWEALCAYQAEPSSSLVAQRAENVPKNRSPAVLTYDHSRILLKPKNSHSNSDYINASPIMDHDPRNPAYIATQGPLPDTVADFWQMVWESGCVVIVMLTPLSENGVRQCCHYWPDEGSTLHHVYEVNLVSEHIWCEDFLVRSFYLKNLQTSETRTVTQFHFLTWSEQGVPSSARSLLDFRRKVNKCYRGRSCPIIVHCSDGAGRSGTYVLIDMVLNRMAKGAKEIDLAATLEHLRDQRPGMVQTKEQFEFALTAVAEEVNAILRALPQ